MAAILADERRTGFCFTIALFAGDAVMSVPFLPPHDYRFPEPVFAPCETDAPVGVSGDLDAGRLLAAYRAGVFPWFAEGGLFYWFAVSPRAVLLPQNLHVGRSLAKTLRNRAYRVTANRCFARVIAACVDCAGISDGLCAAARAGACAFV